MNGWKFVEQERLRVGDPLPEGCALVPAGPFGRHQVYAHVGEVVYDLGIGGLVSIVEADDDVPMIKTTTGTTRTSAGRLFRVVEPIPTVPQKLGRLPKIGENFWVKMECLDIDHDCDVKAEIVDNVKSDLDDVVWLTKRTFIEDSRYDELKALKAELLDLETKIYDLEASIRKSQ